MCESYIGKPIGIGDMKGRRCTLLHLTALKVSNMSLRACMYSSSNIHLRYIKHVCVRASQELTNRLSEWIRVGNFGGY